MTVEEAAERILRGDPLMPCLTCGGMGFVFTGQKSPDGDTRFRVCTTCDMTGMVYESSYKRACRLLGHPLPERPQPFTTPKPKKEYYGVLHRYAEEDVDGSLRLMTELRGHPPLDEP